MERGIRPCKTTAGIAVRWGQGEHRDAAGPLGWAVAGFLLRPVVGRGTSQRKESDRNSAREGTSQRELLSQLSAAKYHLSGRTDRGLFG